jgi:Ran-binding protein 1
MYRFDKEANEWKERGTGDLKFLKNIKTGQIRILMRREKTHKICANHLVIDGMELKASIGSDKSWLYVAPADFSEGEARNETLTVRFASPEHAKEFKENFEKAKEVNKAPLPASAEALAEKVSGLKLEEKDESKKKDESQCCKEKKSVEAEKKDAENCKCAKDESCKEKCVGCECVCQA